MRLFKILEDSVSSAMDCDVVDQPAILDQESMEELTVSISLKIFGDNGLLLPSPPDDPRAYFVWRMARFHGGADLAIPIEAEMQIRAWPRQVRDFLDSLASLVAEQTFGTSIEGQIAYMQKFP